MAKQRSDTHLSEDTSESMLKRLLPSEWVIRKLHPDYGVDLSIEVFERISTKIPTMGEFIFVQLKSTSNLTERTINIRSRKNVEKFLDAEEQAYSLELDTVSFVVDADTIDNARLMGPSTPLILFVADISSDEVYYVCLTDYFDKILEPRGFDFSKQATVTIYIPKSNRLTLADAHSVMRFFSCRSKLYAMFNLAQFQFRETRYLLDDLSGSTSIDKLCADIRIIHRFALRLRAMPIWNRPTVWALIEQYRVRLDDIIAEIDSGVEHRVRSEDRREIFGSTGGMSSLVRFAFHARGLWEQLSAVGQTFEDIVREWFLPTYIGQLSSGDPSTFREIPQKDG